jgi:hypothetical protein
MNLERDSRLDVRDVAVATVFSAAYSLCTAMGTSGRTFAWR